MDPYYPLHSDASSLWGAVPISEDNNPSDMMALDGYLSTQQPPMQGPSAITQDPLSFHPDGMEQYYFSSSSIPGSSFPTDGMDLDPIREFTTFSPAESYSALPDIAGPAGYSQTCISPSELSAALERTSISAPSMGYSYNDPGHYAPMQALPALGASEPVFRLMGWPGEGDLGESHLNADKGKQREDETSTSKKVGGYSGLVGPFMSGGVSTPHYDSPSHSPTPFSSSPSGSSPASPYRFLSVTNSISTLATEISPPPPSPPTALAPVPSVGTERVKKTVRSRKQPTGKGKGSAALALAQLTIKNNMPLTSPYGTFVPYPLELASGSDVMIIDEEGGTAGVRAGRKRRNGHIPSPVIVPGLVKKSRGRKVPTAREGKKDRLFVCPVGVCEKAYKRNEHRKRHVRAEHTNEAVFKCPAKGCGKVFNRADNLAQHARTHL